jgi:hypothetical protein
VGASIATRKRLSVGGLVAALHECFRPETVERARAMAARIEQNGARIAAQRLVGELGRDRLGYHVASS